MVIERLLRGMAGVVVLASLALGLLVSPWFLAFTVFVGLNLLQSAITDWCPAMWLLRRLGFQRCSQTR